MAAALGPDLDLVYPMDLRFIGMMRWKTREALEKGATTRRGTKRWRAMLHCFGWVEVGRKGPVRINTKRAGTRPVYGHSEMERAGAEASDAEKPDQTLSGGVEASNAEIPRTSVEDLGIVRTAEGVADLAAIGNATLKKFMRRVWTKAWWSRENCLGGTKGMQMPGWLLVITRHAHFVTKVSVVGQTST